jgi:hypothetical protein
MAGGGCRLEYSHSARASPVQASAISPIVPLGCNNVHASTKAGCAAIHWIWDYQDVTPCRQVQLNRCFGQHSWTSTAMREVTWHKTEFSLCLYVYYILFWGFILRVETTGARWWHPTSIHFWDLGHLTTLRVAQPMWYFPHTNRNLSQLAWCTKAKNEWKYTSTPPVHLRKGHVSCLHPSVLDWNSTRKYERFTWDLRYSEQGLWIIYCRLRRDAV